jgi:hypothetical protein
VTFQTFTVYQVRDRADYFPGACMPSGMSNTLPLVAAKSMAGASLELV